MKWGNEGGKNSDKKYFVNVGGGYTLFQKNYFKLNFYIIIQKYKKMNVNFFVTNETLRPKGKRLD